MTVRELIQRLLERPMNDKVVFHQDGKSVPGFWTDLDEEHIAPGNGITIIDLDKKYRDHYVAGP